MAHESVDDRAQRGREARARVSRSSHADWAPAPDRADPVGLLEEQNATRLPWLLPTRHERMRVSPFTFYRGTARIMAADLAGTPASGLAVQLCGDAHLSNFGVYGSPERRLVFDVNDFDETLQGPWEWDVKRLAASFTIAGQHLGFSPRDVRDLTARAVAAYRTAMVDLAALGFLDLWYQHTDVDDLRVSDEADPAELKKRIDRFERRARHRTSLQALSKLAVSVDGRYQIRSDPPVLVPLRDLPDPHEAATLEAAAHKAFEAYKTTLQDDRRWLLDRYTIVDAAVKVVGVGSVGTRCFIFLLEGRDRDDPLFLQGKESSVSVLQDHLAPSPYGNQGQRIVEGQRLMQAQSDLFLGWTESLGKRDFYLRQLRDWKGSMEVEEATLNQMRFYAGVCGRTLARGHARSGDAVAIAAYLGGSDKFDRAVCEFADTYAAQNLTDYQRFLGAIEEGRLPVPTAGSGTAVTWD